MRSWALQDAKAKLSEVIAEARRDGPQMITRRGVEEVVVVPVERWRTLSNPRRPTLLDAIRSGPSFALQVPARGRRTRKPPIL